MKATSQDRSGPEGSPGSDLLFDAASLVFDDERNTNNAHQAGLQLNLFQTLLDQIPDFLFIKDINCRFVMANAAIAAAYGFTRTENLLGKTDFDLHPLPVAQGFFDIEQKVIGSGSPRLNLEEKFPDASGVLRFYSTSKIPLRNRKNEIVGLLGVARDITDRKRLEQLQGEQGLILEMIVKNAPVPFVLDRLTNFVEANLEGIHASLLLLDPSTGSLRTGAAPSLPKAFSDAIDGTIIGPNVGSCGTAAFRRETVVVSDTWTDPLWNRYHDLARAFGLRSCWSSPILSQQGSVLGTFAMYSATVRSPTAAEFRLMEIVTRIAGIAIDRERSEHQMHYMTHHDALTGLPNRLLLNSRLAQALEGAKRASQQVFVIAVDLDHFKMINEGLGHAAGDRLLKAIADRMVGGVTEVDVIARLSGDQFVVMLSNRSETRDVIVELLDRLQAAVSEPIEIAGRNLSVTCSMGIAVYPRDGTSVEDLLMNADAAMYSAKKSGRDRIKFYRPDMSEKNQERLALQEHLRHAVARSEFHLVYQPQVDLRSGRIFAVEALLRWTHPSLGSIPPATFIPIAEETGLIVAIGDWALREACRQNRAWQELGTGPITVAVNVSARQFDDSNWVHGIREALHDSGMAAQCLELEVTESMLMHDVSRAIATMETLKAAGVQFAIDDFGTGYSSLSALKRFPVSRLKIDQSFVRDLAIDENDRAIASAVISMGHDLGLRVIAEGVENPAQLAFLRRSGCDEIQGYLTGKPMSGDEIGSILIAQPESMIGPAVLEIERQFG